MTTLTILRNLALGGAVLTVAACGSPASSAGAGSPPVSSSGPGVLNSTRPVTSSPSPGGQVIPANAFRVRHYDHTSIAAWCIVQKTTDENGNPLDAAEVVIDNFGPYYAEIYGVGIDLFTKSGQHVHVSGTELADDTTLVQTGGTVEAPSGQITDIGGLSTVVNGGSSAAEVQPNVNSCTVYSIDQYTNPKGARP